LNTADSIQGYETGGFRVDPGQRVLYAADGTRIPLPSRAFELLLFFVRNPGELIDKNRLMAAVWPNTVVEENNLNQSIGALRKALAESPGKVPASIAFSSRNPAAGTGSSRRCASSAPRRPVGHQPPLPRRLEIADPSRLPWQ
jgi:hypothetical protein